MAKKVSVGEMRESWEKMFSRIDKYFPKACQKETDIPTWYFIIPERKQWAFEILNKVWCNMNIGQEWSEPFHPYFAPGKSIGFIFTDIDCHKAYYIYSKRYCNGNTLILIQIKKY